MSYLAVRGHNRFFVIPNCVVYSRSSSQPFFSPENMSSGFGLNGGPSRCFPFWQDVLACYVLNTTAEDTSGKSKCQAPLSDYYECLHHNKEAARVSTLQAEYHKRMRDDPRADTPTSNQIRKLGILDASDEEKHIYRPKWLPKSNGGSII